MTSIHAALQRCKALKPMDGPFYDDAVALLRSSLTDAEALLQMVDEEPRTPKKRPVTDADAEGSLEAEDEDAHAPKKRPAAAPKPSPPGPGTPSGPETGTSISISSSTSNSSTQSILLCIPNQTASQAGSQRFSRISGWADESSNAARQEPLTYPVFVDGSMRSVASQRTEAEPRQMNIGCRRPYKAGLDVQDSLDIWCRKPLSENRKKIDLHAQWHCIF